MASVWIDGNDSPIDLSPPKEEVGNEFGADYGDIQIDDSTKTQKNRVHTEPSKKFIKPLSPFSRLLAPTESFLSKEQPLYGRPSRRHKSPPKRASTGSAMSDDGESRYLQLTASASRRAELAREKKDPVPADPREIAWDTTPLKSGVIDFELDPTVDESPAANQPLLYPPPPQFKDVKSRLHEPTTASVKKTREYQTRTQPGSPDEPNKLHPRPFSPNRVVTKRKEELTRFNSPGKRASAYDHIPSRLYEYTASRKAFVENLKSADVDTPAPKPVTRKSLPTPPACAQKETKAMMHGRREKYTPESAEAAAARKASPVVNISPPSCSEKVTKAMENGKRDKFDGSDPRDIGAKARQHGSAFTSPGRSRTGSASSATSSSLSGVATSSTTNGSSDGVVQLPPPPFESPSAFRRSPPKSPKKLYADVTGGGFGGGKKLSPTAPAAATSATERRRAIDNSTTEWRVNEALPYALSCLEIMKGFVPPDVHVKTATELQVSGLSAALALRIVSKPCLWLVRRTPDSILADISSDFTTRYDYSKQALDIVELAALYACLPARFDLGNNDIDARREKWRGTLEYQLKRLMKQKEYMSFPAELRRNSAYEDQVPVFSDGNRSSSRYNDDIGGIVVTDCNQIPEEDTIKCDAERYYGNVCGDICDYGNVCGDICDTPAHVLVAVSLANEECDSGANVGACAIASDEFVYHQ